MIDLIWLIPLVPLLGFLINGIGRNVLPKSLVGLLGSGVVLVSFLLSCGVFAEVYSARQAGESATFVQSVFEWINAGSLRVSLSFLVDPLSAIMLLIVTGIGFLIHVYSIGYMKQDAGFAKFFAFLNLFVFFMLLLVLGSNYVVMFIGWEGVGLCSYLLIGFWFKNKEFASAPMTPMAKITLQNRI